MKVYTIMNNKFLSCILISIIAVTISGCTLHKSSIKDAQIEVPPAYTTEA
jgi:hypothetical protein